MPKRIKDLDLDIDSKKGNIDIDKSGKYLDLDVDLSKVKKQQGGAKKGAKQGTIQAAKRGRPKGSKTVHQKKPNAWIEEIKKVRAENPGMSYKEAMKKASANRKGGVIPSGEKYHQTPTDRLHEAEPNGEGVKDVVKKAVKKAVKIAKPLAGDIAKHLGKLGLEEGERLLKLEMDPRYHPTLGKISQSILERVKEGATGSGVVGEYMQCCSKCANDASGAGLDDLYKCVILPKGPRPIEADWEVVEPDDDWEEVSSDKPTAVAVDPRIYQAVIQPDLRHSLGRRRPGDDPLHSIGKPRSFKGKGGAAGGNPVAAALISAIAPHAISAIGKIAKKAFGGKDKSGSGQAGGFLPALFMAARIAAKAARMAARAARKSSRKAARQVKKSQSKDSWKQVQKATKLPKHKMKEEAKKWFEGQEAEDQQEMRQHWKENEKMYKQKYAPQIAQYHRQHSVGTDKPSHGQHVTKPSAPSAPTAPTANTGKGIVGDLYRGKGIVGDLYRGKGIVGDLYSGAGTPGDYSFNELGVRRGQSHGMGLDESQRSEAPVNNVSVKSSDLFQFVPARGLMGITEVPTNQFFTPMGGDENIGIWEQLNDIDQYINSAPTVDDGITVIAPTTMSINPTALSGMPQNSSAISTIRAITQESTGSGIGPSAERGFVYGPGISLTAQARWASKHSSGMGMSGGDITRIGFPGATGAGILPTENVITGTPISVSARGRGLKGGMPAIRGSNIASWST